MVKTLNKYFKFILTQRSTPKVFSEANKRSLLQDEVERSEISCQAYLTK
jgi:hypothetical protein